MASMAGCVQHIVVSTTTRASSSSKEFPVAAVCKGVSPVRDVAWRRRSGGNASDGIQGSLLASSSTASSLCGLRLAAYCRGRGGGARRAVVGVVRAYKSGSDVVGEDPDWSEEDFVVVGLAHCFKKDDNQKLVDSFVIEPIPAGQLECMENGGATCYKHAASTSLGAALKQDVSVLPKEFASASFCEEFDFRTKCASRTWKRDHAVEHLTDLVPKDGSVRSDWNFSLQDKRVLNQEHVVKDSDNIKQDMSIDVYGRTEKEDEMTAEIGQLYNV